MSDTEILLDADEVARRIGCTRRHVERLNSHGEGPPSVRVGRRLRRYPERLFEEWIKSLHGARMAGGRKILDGLKDALAQNVARYTNIYTADVVIEEGRMTDLEREAWAALKGEITSWPAQIVAALAAARREGAEEARAEFADAIRTALKIGAEEMRERAAHVCERNHPDLDAWECAQIVRALPLTPEGDEE